jgi:hypothetical protein
MRGVGCVALSCLGAALPLLLGAGAPEPPPGAVLATLPFLDSEESNRVYVDLAPESARRRLRFLLDTGATDSVVTPLAARAMGVRVRRIKPDPYRRRTLLGRDVLFHVDTSSSDTGSKTGWEYGLLGGSFLAEYVVEIDFEARRVRLLDADRYRVPESVDHPHEAVLPLNVVANRPGFEVVVNGRPLEVLLDTGAPLGLMLSGRLAREGDVTSSEVEGFSMGGVLGAVAAELGEARSLRVGHFLFERYPVAVAPHGFFNQGLPGDSIAGFDLLAQFLVRIDYPRARLWLRRRTDWAVTWGGEPWLGWPDPAVSAPPGD